MLAFLYNRLAQTLQRQKMPVFKEVSTDDIKYYLRRANTPEDNIHVCREFTSYYGNAAPKRYVYKQIEGAERYEVVELLDELILYSTPKGRDQVKVTVYGSDGRDRYFVLQQYRNSKPLSGTSVSFHECEWKELHIFLDKLQFMDFTGSGNYTIRQSEVKSAATSEERELLDALKSLEGTNREEFLERLTSAQAFTNEDLNVISGRRTGLNKFREQLYHNSDWDEKKWQLFFQINPWIFGYGLDYQFLSIVQREAAISNVDVDRSNTANADFLLKAKDFTVLVEMKEPNTPLFRGKDKYRSRTWGISTDLMDAVSQILGQKAEWQVKARSEEIHDAAGKLISQKTIDPKAILIVGMRSSLEGNDREKQTKLNTFELFRRDSRNIEIITYDELYDRAFYIVNQRVPVEDDR